MVLAIGHSARDTFEWLQNSGIIMEQKSFAIGVRIEHAQEMINKIKYGTFAGYPSLGAADYRMVVHLDNGRNVYTFCMCPGGSVVAASSEENGVVTNGMSEYKRDGRNAGSALFVTLNKGDFKSGHPLAGVMFQRGIETAAFKAGGAVTGRPSSVLRTFSADEILASFRRCAADLSARNRVCPYRFIICRIISMYRSGRRSGKWVNGCPVSHIRTRCSQAPKHAALLPFVF